MARDRAVLGFAGPFADAHHVPESPGAGVLGPLVRAALGPLGTQTGRQFLAESATGLHNSVR
jgi:hypothetical protein